MTKEEELLSDIEKANKRLDEARLIFKDLRQQYSDQETEFIGAKLDLERLTEELRLLRLQTIKE